MEIKELPGAPIVGHLLDFRSRRLELLRRVAGECGDLGVIRLGPLRAVVVSSARMAREILTERHDDFCRVPLQGMDGIKALFGDGMVVADGDKHRAQRKRMMSVFSRQRMNANVAVISSEVEKWQASLLDGQEIDLADELDRLTRRIARQTLFGMSATTELDEELESSLTKGARLAMAEVARLLPLPAWVPTPHNVEFRRVIRVLDRRVMDLIAQRRRQGGSGDDALSVLASEAERGLTDREVRDDLMSLFVAGNEATANALFWCLYHLTQDDKLAEQLRADTRERTEQAPKGPDVAGVPLATDIFRESMRLYPAAHLILRRAAKDLDLDGASIAKGVMVLINGFMIHRDAKFHEAPDEFRPARFRDGADKEMSVGYLPFGAGPRTCIGNHFAMLQGPLSLMIINRELCFHPVTAGNVELSTGFAIAPRGGYRTRVRRMGEAYPAPRPRGV